MSRPDRTARRWPSRNFLAELEPTLRDPISVEDLARRSPRLRRLYRTLRSASSAVRSRVSESEWIRLADTRALIGTTEFELAFNLGFEHGFAVGGREAFRRRHDSDSKGIDRKLDAALLSILWHGDSAPEQIVARLLEVAWAINQRPLEFRRQRTPPRADSKRRR